MKSLKSLFAFVATVLASDKRRALLMLVLMLLASALQSVSVLILLPMLAAIGLELGAAGTAQGGGALTAMLDAVDQIIALVPFSDPLISVLLLFVLVLMLKDGLTYISTVLRTRLQQDFHARLRSDLYRRLLSASWQNVSKLQSHDVSFHLTSNMGSILSAIIQTLQMLSSAVMVLAYTVLAVIAAPSLVLFLVPMALLLLYPMLKLFRLTRRQAARVRELQKAHHGRGQQFVLRHRQIKNFDKQDSEVQANDQVAKQVADGRVALAKAQALGRLLQNMAAIFVMVATVYIALRLLGIAPAGLLIVVFAASRLLPNLLQLQSQAQTLVSLLPAYEAYQDLLSGLDKPDVLEHAERPDIRELALEHVCVPGRLNLSEADFKLRRGEITCLVGASGAGKSTFCDVLAGLLPGLEAARVNQQPLSAQECAQLTKEVSYLEQGTTLWQQTVREALSWSQPELSEAQMNAILNEVGLVHRVLEHPMGLDAEIGDAGHWLSGGELKRLALAQALLRPSQILILDEFTANLDPQTEAQLLDIIAGRKQQRIVIIATHSQAPLSRADNIYRLSRSGIALEPRRFDDALEA